MKKLLLAVSFFFGISISPACAQLFRPGWVALAKGDTLRGEIEDNGWDEAPTEVRFRSAPGATISSYEGSAIQAFRLNGGRYFKKQTLPLDRTAHTQVADLSSSQARNPQPETFLAEVLVAGAASLFYTGVQGVPHYFVQRPGHPVLELAARRYLAERQEQRVILDGNNYKGELNVYFIDCPAAVQAISAFSPRELIAVVQAYNRQCANPPQAGTEYRASGTNLRLGVSFGIVAGGRYTSCALQAQDGTGKGLDGLNLDGTVQPIGGLYADFFTPGRRLAFHLAGLLTQIGRATDQELSTGAPTVTARVNNRRSVLEARVGARYFWAPSSLGLRFFAGAGLTLPYSLTSDFASTLTFYEAGQLRTGTYIPDPYPNSFFRPYVEAGLRYGRLTVTLDGRVGSSFTTYLSTPSVYASSGPTTYTGENYTCRVWYAGASLSFALAQVK